MSLLPEIALQRLMARGIMAVRKDLTIIDQLFWNADTKTIQNVKDLLSNVKIHIILQAPRIDTVLPCIAIVPVGEKESIPFVGDVMGDAISPPDVLSFGDDTSAATMTPTSIDADLLGEPQRLFKEGIPISQQGAGYNATFRIFVRGLNYYLTVFLYNIVKAILIQNRLLLDQNGVHNMILSGGSVSVDTELLPEPVYTRTLDINFMYLFDLYTKAPVISSLEVSILETSENPEFVGSEATITADGDFV